MTGQSTLEYMIPDWPDAPATIGALSTSRRGGVSMAPYGDSDDGGGLNLGTHVGDAAAAVAANRKIVRSLLPGDPRWLTQVHGNTVMNAAAIRTEIGDAPAADASIATQPGVVCAIGTADCLPVLFCDRDGGVVGAAHAGWRGLAAGILEETVAQMRMAGAADIVAWLGPAIGPANFEVGEEVLAAFAARDSRAANAFIPGLSGKYFADIYQLARMALGQIGIDRVSGGGLCTVADARRFYSYRRDGVTGRMASLIWIK